MHSKNYLNTFFSQQEGRKLQNGGVVASCPRGSSLQN